jgi:toxin ParE1/3/4
MQVVLLPAAREDLRDIWLYGVTRWSMAQADRYSDALDGAIGLLAMNPFLAAPAETVGPGLRRLLFESHAVFYRVEGDVVEVVRVLHQSRDAGVWVG